MESGSSILADSLEHKLNSELKCVVYNYGCRREWVQLVLDTAHLP